MKRKRFMQCNLLSINIFLEDFSNDNVVVHVRFELTIFVTTISRRFLPLKGIIMRTAKCSLRLWWYFSLYLLLRKPSP